MKKIICIFLCLALLLVCGCSKNTKNTLKTPLKTPLIIPQFNDTNDSLLQQYLNNINEYKSPIRQFGTPASYIDMSENLVIGILYPETNIDELNTQIKNWISTLAAEYKSEVANKENLTEQSELAIAYESYLIGNETASIKFSGVFFAEYLTHPIDIVKTFNVNISENKLIKITDMFSSDNINLFIEKVIEKANIDKENVDDKLLDNAIFTHDGIEIIFNCGYYHPISSGTIIITFTYEEINNFLIPNFDHTQISTKEPTSALEITLPKKQTIDPTKPMIALTFDDGPSAYTERLLDIFATYGGNCTFFVIGNLIDGRKNTLIRITNEGHEIGNHTWDHRQLTKLSKEEITDQIMMTRAKIYEITGTDCTIVRPPYGACNNIVKDVGVTTNVAFVNWSVDTLDWKTKDAQLIYNEIINNASNGDIVLCHDLHKTTVDAMELVIPKLISDGYQLVTVSELMQYSNTSLESGKIYYCK